MKVQQDIKHKEKVERKRIEEKGREKMSTDSGLLK